MRRTRWPLVTARVTSTIPIGNATKVQRTRRSMLASRQFSFAEFCLMPTAEYLLPGYSMALVQPLAQVLAGLEERHELLFNRDGRPRARIAADARSAMLDGEGPETAK